MKQKLWDRELTLKIVLENPPAGVDFGLQKGRGSKYETIQKQRSNNNNLEFEFPITVKLDKDSLPDFLGICVQGTPPDRFVYIDIGTYAGQEDTPWSRRLKIPLKGITSMIENVPADSNMILETRVPGTGRDMGPNCGTVKPFNGWHLVQRRILMMERDKIQEYYNTEIEKTRLDLDNFKLEGLRTKEIISRFLTPESLSIADIGGGAGFYSFWLQSLGHRVSLVDLSPKNVELANEYAKQHGTSLASCEVGEATALAFADNHFEMALLMGPLYHLTDKQQRVKALREVRRVLKPGGTIIAAVISRYASFMDGLRRDLVNDDRFEKILLDDLKTGVHLNATDNLDYFTTAFFHTPREIRSEVSESGLKLEKLVAVESAGWVIDNFTEKIKDQGYWAKIQKIIGSVESNEDLIAISPHIIAIARKV